MLPPPASLRDRLASRWGIGSNPPAFPRSASSPGPSNGPSPSRRGSAATSAAIADKPIAKTVMAMRTSRMEKPAFGLCFLARWIYAFIAT